MKPSRDISGLLEIMAALRAPQTGCPWDVEQTFATIAPYTLEEAYEVVDAIEREDMQDLREELGDLLLQVVFHARMAEENGDFDFADVVEAITTKMIRRHPHVFGDATAREAGMAKGMWEKIKAKEKEERRARRMSETSFEDDETGILADVPRTLPAHMRALKLQAKASRVGFDWGSAGPIFAKIREEMEELEEAIGSPSPDENVKDEFGDLLFAVVNLGRHLGLDPEQALARTNKKFETRFAFIEKQLSAAGRRPDDASLDEMEALWQKAKQKAFPDGPKEE